MDNRQKDYFKLAHFYVDHEFEAKEKSFASIMSVFIQHSISL